MCSIYSRFTKVYVYRNRANMYKLSIAGWLAWLLCICKIKYTLQSRVEKKRRKSLKSFFGFVHNAKYTWVIWSYKMELFSEGEKKKESFAREITQKLLDNGRLYSIWTSIYGYLYLLWHVHVFEMGISSWISIFWRTWQNRVRTRLPKKWLSLNSRWTKS
jgi:hypothetical protein